MTQCVSNCRFSTKACAPQLICRQASLYLRCLEIAVRDWILKAWNSVGVGGLQVADVCRSFGRLFNKQIVPLNSRGPSMSAATPTQDS